MPVRKIPKNHLVVTGGYSSQKNPALDHFESPLEREYFILLDFDEAVRAFEPQPVRIPVPGVQQGYVPDVLVRYHPDQVSGLEPKPALVEVKHTDDLAKNAKKYAAKFECAKRFAEEAGWEFKIVDQTQIRTPRLENLKFLRGYRTLNISSTDVARVLEFVDEEPQSHLQLLEQLATTEVEQLYWLPIIWFMLLKGHLSTNMDEAFGGDVLVARGARLSWPS